MNQEQRFLFDNLGYVVISDALTAAQIESLRSTLRQSTEQFDPVAKEANPLHWGPVWRELLTLPVLRDCLEELAGNHEMRAFRESRDRDLPTYRLDHINVHTHVTKGFEGMPLHGGWRTTGGSQYFRYHDGKFYNGLVAVAIELHDTHPNGGGFCCIPGSHKSNLSLPPGWEKPDTDPYGIVQKIALRAGDLVVFTETLIHGTAPWNVDAPRKTIFYKFSPHGTSWSADFYDPDDYREYDDMDTAKLAVLEPPNARYRGRPTHPGRS